VNPFRKMRCRECRGTGYAEPAPCFTFGNDCPVCHGSGWLLPSITCPRCNAVSYNMNDVEYGYCARCHDWTTPREPHTQGDAP
jgi:DnaJ-class molecular chaperone